MRLLYLLIPFAVVGCATTSGSKASSSSYELPRGYWAGDIVWNTVPANEGEENTGEYKIELSNCDGNALVRVSHESIDSFTSYVPFSGSSKLGNHVIYWINSSSKKDDWVETQVWNIVELGDNKLAIQWARMVSNPSKKVDDPSRIWTKNGFGILKKYAQPGAGSKTGATGRGRIENLPYC
jgi:hypothetical protein